MTERKVTHATFTIERSFKAAPERVFTAFADPVAKARWFGGPSEWATQPGTFDFRVGGRERVAGGPKDGQLHIFDCTYYDIVPNERIVYAYEMHLDDIRISVSLTTVELKPAGKGTKLTFTEQGAFLDGFDDNGGREEGSRWLLAKLAESLGEVP